MSRDVERDDMAVMVRRANLLYDTFDGAGLLTAHTPNTGVDGSSWLHARGAIYGFTGLSGGRVVGPDRIQCFGLYDCGEADVEIVATLGVVAAASAGVAFRCNADASQRWAVRFGATDDQIIIWNQASNNVLQVSHAIDIGDLSVVVGMSDEAVKVWLDGAVVMEYYSLTNNSNTYHGIANYVDDPDVSWAGITVKRQSKWQRVAILGDSISTDVQSGGWTSDFRDTYRSGKTVCHMRSYGASKIMPNGGNDMADHVADTANDDCDVILVGYGHNDSETGEALADTYRDNLVTLATSNPDATIYCINEWPTTSDANRTAKNARIAEAVSEAAALGVTCELWDTDSPSPWIVPATDTDDGTHPNAAGAAKILAQIVSRLS